MAIPAPVPPALVSGQTVYAYTMAYDPATGEVRFDTETGMWVTPRSPALECVLLVLRSQLGSASAQPTLGVDWNAIRKASNSAPAAARDAISAGLRRLVEQGTISRLSVSAELGVPLVGQPSTLLYEVTFVDTRLAEGADPITVRFRG